MKSTKTEIAAVAAADQEARSALASARREAAQQRKLERERAKDVWYQTTKIVVPAWFGQYDVPRGLKLSETFTVAGLLALVCVGKAEREHVGEGKGTACEITMQLLLRRSMFDRQEACELASVGFRQLRLHKLVRQVKKPNDDFAYGYYVLSAKGRRWYELIESSAGCAPDRGLT